MVRKGSIADYTLYFVRRPSYTRMLKNTKPTATELRCFQVLWNDGLTVREVHERLPDCERLGYTSVLKMLQVMLGKARRA